MPAGAQPSNHWGFRKSRFQSNRSANRTSPGRRCGHRAAYTCPRTSLSAALSLRSRASNRPSSPNAGSASQPPPFSYPPRARPSAPKRQKYAASRRWIRRAADAAHCFAEPGDHFVIARSAHTPGHGITDPCPPAHRSYSAGGCGSVMPWPPILACPPRTTQSRPPRNADSRDPSGRLRVMRGRHENAHPTKRARLPTSAQPGDGSPPGPSGCTLSRATEAGRLALEKISVTPLAVRAPRWALRLAPGGRPQGPPKPRPCAAHSRPEVRTPRPNTTAARLRALSKRRLADCG